MLLTLISAYGVFLLAVMSPGPDFVMVVRNSVRFNVRAGVGTALGISIANMVHIGYVQIGLGALIAHSIVAFNVLKLFAAAYLIYLGCKAIRSRPHTVTADEPVATQQQLTTRAAFMQGFITNALNPKAALFWLSFLSIVISPDMPQGLLFGFVVLMLVTAFGWFSAVAYFMSRSKIRAGFIRCGHWFDRVMGAVLVALGIKIALASK